jgi:hypothetical protein
MLSFSQENTTETNTLELQFDKIYRTSSSYQAYKVIGKQRYKQLKADVLDSLKTAKDILQEKEISIRSKEETILKLNNVISTTKNSLEEALSKNDTISLLGMKVSKTSYNLILWSLIALLTLGVLFFSFKFKNSHLITKKAEDTLLDVEQEFEQYRKKSLLAEQQLRRKLQDEINKQSN